MLNLPRLLNAAPLGDARLNARALTLVKAIAQGQMNATSGTQGVGSPEPWAQTMGSFRFFNNEQVTLPALYQPCHAALSDLVPKRTRCYVAHDISVVDYSGHTAKHDLIPVGDGRGLGYELYSALVLDSQGRPLGPIVQEVRTSKGCLSSERVEPFAFVDHYTQVERALVATARILPERGVVDLLDREFDELQLERQFFRSGRRFVIRAQHLRRRVLCQGEPMSLGQAAAPVVLQSAGSVQRQGEVWDLFQGETHVLFPGPSYRGYARRRVPRQPGEAVSLRVVISELRRPGEEPQRWVLLTNLDGPLSDVVQAYLWRWRIERFFFLTKVGFRLEQWRQESGEGIARRLGVTMLAAMALYQMQGSSDPQVQQLVVQVAKLGGWLGRKRDRMGPIVLMRGMVLLLGMLTAFEQYGERRIYDLAHQFGSLFGF